MRSQPSNSANARTSRNASTRSCSTKARGTLRPAMWLQALALVVSCGGQTAETGGESNWLSCRTDDDCPSAERCVRKRCTDASLEVPASGAADGSAPNSNSIDAGPPASSRAEESPSTDDDPEAPEPDEAAIPDVAVTDGDSVREASGEGASTDAGVASSDEPSHCAYPSATRASDATGFVSPPIDWTRQSCLSSLSEPVLLELDTTTDEQRLAFSYDVNLDGIGDLFYRTVGSDLETEPFNLWVSELVGDEVRFVHERCAIPEVGPELRRLHVLDLDRDGVSDLVAEGTNWLIALRNTPAGFEQVLVHGYAPSTLGGWASIVKVGVANVSGDEAPDLVVGYDRTPDGAIEAEIGVMIFEGTEAAPELTLGQSYPWSLGNDSFEGAGFFYGEFAFERVSDSADRLWLQTYDADTNGWRVESLGNVEDPLPLSVATTRVHRLWGAQFLRGPPLLAVLSETTNDTAEVDWLLRSGGSFLDAGGLEPVFFPLDNRELGGGVALPLQFVVDANGDQIADFVEFGFSEEDATPQLAVHTGDMLVHFDPAIVHDLAGRRAADSDPFVTVDGRTLGFIAYDGTAGADAPASPPMLQRFVCP